MSLYLSSFIPKQKIVKAIFANSVTKSVTGFLYGRCLTSLISSSYYDTKDEALGKEVISNMLVYEDFLTEAEEMSLLNEIEPYMKRLRYEFDHWDDAIHGYRETERRNWNKENSKILDRVKELAFPPGVPQLAYVHILDLKKEGYIKPHIDAVKFCGNTIAGLCLLSSSVMRLVHDKEKDRFADVLLKRRSLYIMKDTMRYNYTHEILPCENSTFKGEPIEKDRRISVILRNEPDTEGDKNDIDDKLKDLFSKVT